MGYETQELPAGGTRFSIREDNIMDLEWPIAAGRLGELNRIDHLDDTLVISRNTAVADAALAASQGDGSLLGLRAYQALLASLNAPELADAGALVGLIVQGDPVLPDVAELLLSDDAPEEVRAQWEALTMQEPPLPLYLLTGLATYRTVDGTYLALHTVFPMKKPLSRPRRSCPNACRRTSACGRASRCPGSSTAPSQRERPRWSSCAWMSRTSALPTSPG